MANANSSISTNNSQIVIIHDSQIQGHAKNDDKNYKTFPKKGNQWTGLILALVVGALFAGNSLMIKRLGDYNALNIGFYRFLGMTLLSVPHFIQASLKKESLVGLTVPITHKPNYRVWLIILINGIVSFGAIMFHFLAIQKLPVADTLVIGSSSSVIVAIIAHLCLKEKCGVVPTISAIITVLGVGIILKPPFLTGGGDFSSESLIGVCYAVLRTFLLALIIICFRELREMNTAFLILVDSAIQFLLDVVVGFAAGTFDPVPNEKWHWWLLFGVTVTAYLGELLLILALKREQAAPFAIVKNSTTTVFAFLLEYAIFGMVPDLLSVLGAIVVSIGVTILALRKWVGFLPPQHPAKRYLRFVLL